MKFFIIFGPPAVGKMSVGTELAKLSGLKLLHNHMSIELVLNFFYFGEEGFRSLDKKIRTAILEEVANSDLKGVIFTYTWALDIQDDTAYIDEFVSLFEQKEAEIYYVELEADLETRLDRNKHPFRLSQKASKRNLELSEKALLYDQEHYRLNTLDGGFDGKNFLKINNNQLSPAEVAKQIASHFQLEILG